MNEYIDKIMVLKQKYSLYDIALDIGISESSLYKFINNGTLGVKTKQKIEEYLGEIIDVNQ